MTITHVILRAKPEESHGFINNQQSLLWMGFLIPLRRKIPRPQEKKTLEFLKFHSFLYINFSLNYYNHSNICLKGFSLVAGRTKINK
jgi:hypothetical protein